VRWLTGEPTIEDVLSDPIVRALMKRDDVDPDVLRRLLEVTAGRLKDRRVRPATPQGVSLPASSASRTDSLAKCFTPAQLSRIVNHGPLKC
jgi:hypothetical protein